MSAYSNMVIADSAAAYWPLDETSGTTADDAVGSNNATCQGGLTLGGADGPLAEGTNKAPNLDGSNDFLTTAYAPFVNGTVRTFEGWAWRDTSTTGDNLFGGHGASGPSLRLVGSSTDAEWRANTGASATIWASAWPGDARWVHWVLVFDESNNTAELWINGVSKGSQAETDAYDAAPGAFDIGDIPAVSRPFDGRLAHVAVYTRALTLSEIQGHYATGLSTLNKPRFLHEAGHGQ